MLGFIVGVCVSIAVVMYLGFSGKTVGGIGLEINIAEDDKK